VPDDRNAHVRSSPAIRASQLACDRFRTRPAAAGVDGDEAEGDGSLNRRVTLVPTNTLNRAPRRLPIGG
jgi:hypothetical protein